MTTRRVFLWLFITSILLSCACYVSVKGRVLSASDKHPIEGASVELVGRNKITTTDKDGYFHIWVQTGFCFDPHIKITAGNYKPFDITFKGTSESRSYVLKSQSESIEYDEPFYPDPNNRQTFVTGTWIEKYSEKFSALSDTITFFLDTIDTKGEIERIKATLRKPN